MWSPATHRACGDCTPGGNFTLLISQHLSINVELNIYR